MSVKDYVSNRYEHDHYGKVVVISPQFNSRTKVNIRVIQRGRGWNETLEKYERYFLGSVLQEDGNRSLQWRQTQTDEYGKLDVVHINTLN